MLNGKTALVTGASRGIGRAVALELARRGAYVVVNYNGSRERAEAVAAEIRAAGGQGACCQCDVSDYEACEWMFRQLLEEQKRIDILVNNAGITRDGLLMRMTEEDFDAVVDINLKGAFHMMRLAARQMLRQRSGRIVNMASVVGVAGNAGQVNYAASKAGIIGMTKSAAKELASRGITVNAVAPGFIETEMTEKLDGKVKEQAIGQIPLGRFGSAQQVAKTVAFLASEDAEYITGQVIHVDGGMVM